MDLKVQLTRVASQIVIESKEIKGNYEIDFNYIYHIETIILGQVICKLETTFVETVDFLNQSTLMLKSVEEATWTLFLAHEREIEILPSIHFHVLLLFL